MKKQNISLTPHALQAIEALQHSNGTYRFYADTLTRLFNHVLQQSDEIGMDATEALDTLRALHFLKSDLRHIAERAGTESNVSTSDDLDDRVESVFSSDDDTSDSGAQAPGDQLDEEEVMTDMVTTVDKLKAAREILREATELAAGTAAKDSVKRRLSDGVQHLNIALEELQDIIGPASSDQSDSKCQHE